MVAEPKRKIWLLTAATNDMMINTGFPGLEADSEPRSLDMTAWNVNHAVSANIVSDRVARPPCVQFPCHSIEVQPVGDAHGIEGNFHGLKFSWFLPK